MYSADETTTRHPRHTVHHQPATGAGSIARMPLFGTFTEAPAPSLGRLTEALAAFPRRFTETSGSFRATPTGEVVCTRSRRVPMGVLLGRAQSFAYETANINQESHGQVLTGFAVAVPNVFFFF